MTDIFVENCVNDYSADCLFVAADNWEERQETLRDLAMEEIQEEYDEE